MKYRSRLLLGFGIIISIFAVLLALNFAALYATSGRIRVIAERELGAERAIQDSAQIVLRVKGQVWDALFLGQARRGEVEAALAEDANAFRRNMDRLAALLPSQRGSFEALNGSFRNFFVFASSYLDPTRPSALSVSPDAVQKFRANQDELMSLIEKRSGMVEREFEASLLGLNRNFRAIVLISLPSALLAVLGALAVSIVLSRRLTRPFNELAGLALSVARGDFGVRATVSGGVGEAEVLASVFNSMLVEIERYHQGLETEVRIRTEELARSNESLVATNGRLASAYAELEEAQDRLVSSERKAVMGRIVASVAHELNTPLAAILSSSRSASDELSAILRSLPDLLEGSLEAERAFFLRCLERARVGLGDLDSHAIRNSRRSMRGELEATGRGDSDKWAEALSDMGFSSVPSEAAALLATERGARLLDLAARAAAVARADEVVALAAARAARVVDTLRSYARRDLPRADAEIDLRAHLDEELLLVPSVAAGRVRVSWSGAPTARVMGDREELGLVWTNILENALRAMGGSGELHVDIRDDGAKASVTIVDDGPGIPEAMRDRVFEPFFTETPMGEGKGLGLDVARVIVERHGGTIGFTSEPGRTAFTVTLDSATRLTRA